MVDHLGVAVRQVVAALQVAGENSMKLYFKRMKNLFLAVLVTFLSINSYGSNINSVNQVPNQREINNVWVSDPQGILSNADINNIDVKVKSIEVSTSYEIAVVI